MEFKTKRRQRCVARLIFVVGIFFFLFWMCVLCRGCFCVRDHVSCRRQDVYFAPQKKKPKTFAKKKRRVARRLLGEEERRKKKKKKGARRTKAPEIDGGAEMRALPTKKRQKRKRPHKPNAAHTREKLGSRGKEKKPQREG